MIRMTKLKARSPSLTAETTRALSMLLIVTHYSISTTIICHILYANAPLQMKL